MEAVRFARRLGRHHPGDALRRQQRRKAGAQLRLHAQQHRLPEWVHQRRVPAGARTVTWVYGGENRETWCVLGEFSHHALHLAAHSPPKLSLLCHLT